MGAGCYYTHNTIPNAKSFWIEVDSDQDNDWFEADYDDLIKSLKNELRELGYCDKHSDNLWNGLYEIVFDSTYYGDGVLVNLESRHENGYHHDDVRLHNLVIANHGQCYRRIQKHLISKGYKLSMASSGYTSYQLTMENL